MKFVVMNRYDLEAGNPCDLQHVIISIRTEGKPVAQVATNSATLRTVLLMFDDLDTPQNVPTVLGGGKPAMLFDEEHAQEIVKAIRECEPEVVICQCEAGISRSSGVAAALAKYFTGDDMFFFRNPKYSPNRLVYRVLLNHLHVSKPITKGVSQ